MAWSGSQHSQSRCLYDLSTVGELQHVMLRTDMKVQNDRQGEKSSTGPGQQYLGLCSYMISPVSLGNQE